MESSLHLELSYDERTHEVRVRARSSGSYHAARMSRQTEQQLQDCLRRIGGALQETATGKALPPGNEPKLCDVEELGEILGPLLLSGQIGHDLRDSQAKVGRQGPLELVLHMEDDYLRRLPWETAAWEGIPLCWRDDILLIRQSSRPNHAVRPLAVAGTLQVLMVVEDEGYPPKEAEEFREQMRGHGVNVAEPLVREGWVEVARQLSEKDYHVLVYVGHMDQQGYLGFAGRMVSSEEFVEEAMKANEQLRCVVLLGCGTWHVAGQRFLAAGLPAVVATHFYMQCGSPRAGVEGFLRELSKKGRIDQAYERLRSSLPEEHQGTPVLWVSGEDRQLFNNDPKQVQLGDYLRRLRKQLDEKQVEAMHRRLLQKDLYQQRQLASDSRDDRDRGKGGHAMQPQLSEPFDQRTVSADQDNRKHLAQSALLQELRKRNASGCWCITGGAGSGKSTLLEHLAWELAGDYVNKRGVYPSRVPLRMNLRDWASKEHATLEVFASSQALQLDAALVKELCHHGSAVLLLDGLDEVRPADKPALQHWLEAQLNHESFKHCSVVLSGRPWAVRQGGLRLFGTQELELTPFGQSDIERYVNRYFADEPDRGRQLLTQAESEYSLRELISCPLWLVLLCLLQEEAKGPLPRRAGDLLEQAMRSMLRRRQLPEEVYLNLLGRMAWWQWTRKTGRRFSQDQALNVVEEAAARDPGLRAELEFSRQTPTDALNALLQRTGILLAEGQGDCRFAEESYLEYLAGRHLARQNEKQVIELFARRIWDPAWEKVWEFAAGRMWRTEGGALASRLVRWLLAEHRAGHDDRGGTLIEWASRFIGLAQSRNEQAAGSSMASIRRDLNDIGASLNVGLFVRRLSAQNEQCWRHAGRILAAVGSTATLERLVEMMDCEDVKYRVVAVAALRAIGSDQALGALICALRDSNVRVRRSAAEALGKIGSDQAIGPLIDALKDNESGVRHGAARALGKIGSDQAIESLLGALRGDDDELCYEAAGALEMIGSSQVIDALILVLKDGELNARRLAAKVLGEIGSDQVIGSLIEVLKDSDAHARYFAAKILSEIGSDQPMGAFVEALKDSDACVRKLAAEALGEIGSDQAVRSLVEVLKDSDYLVRFCAAEALGKIGSDQAIESLIKALKDSDASVRKCAAEAIGLTSSPQAVDAAIDALRDEDAHVRLYVADVLGKIGSDQVIRGLIKMLKDSDAGTRQYAAEVLGKIGSDQAVGSLVEVLKDNENGVRMCAAEALGKIASPKTAGPLCEAMTDTDAGVRRCAAEALASISSDQAVDSLITALKDSEDSVRVRAANALGHIGSNRAVEPLVETLKDSDAVVRHFAAEALGNIGALRAVGALVEALKDSYAYTRESAAEGLGKIGSDQAAEALIEVLRDNNQLVRRSAAEALGKIGSDQAIGPLMTALKDSDQHVRYSAAEALGKIGSDQAIGPLTKALKDSDSNVRWSAAFAIDGITPECDPRSLHGYRVSDDLRNQPLLIPPLYLRIVQAIATLLRISIGSRLALGIRVENLPTGLVIDAKGRIRGRTSLRLSRRLCPRRSQ